MSCRAFWRQLDGFHSQSFWAVIQTLFSKVPLCDSRMRVSIDREVTRRNAWESWFIVGGEHTEAREHGVQLLHEAAAKDTQIHTHVCTARAVADTGVLRYPRPHLSSHSVYFQPSKKIETNFNSIFNSSIYLQAIWFRPWTHQSLLRVPSSRGYIQDCSEILSQDVAWRYPFRQFLADLGFHGNTKFWSMHHHVQQRMYASKSGDDLIESMTRIPLCSIRSPLYQHTFSSMFLVACAHTRNLHLMNNKPHQPLASSNHLRNWK